MADLIPEAKRERAVAKAKKLVASTLAATAFACCPMVAVAARPGGRGLYVGSFQAEKRTVHSSKLVFWGETRPTSSITSLYLALHLSLATARHASPLSGKQLRSCWSSNCSEDALLCAAHTAHAAAASAGEAEGEAAAPAGIQDLVRVLLDRVRVRAAPDSSAPFLFYIDHCFAIKGQGTVLTGGWRMKGRILFGSGLSDRKCEPTRHGWLAAAQLQPHKLAARACAACPSAAPQLCTQQLSPLS